MKILFDISHPAHVHFFRSTIRNCINEGHIVKVLSRSKDMTVHLLDSFEIEHKTISTAKESFIQRAWELVIRVSRLVIEIRRFAPNVIIAREGLFASIAGALARVPCISFDDTDDARIQLALYTKFATRIYTDIGYSRRFSAKHRFYRGISCASYLNPDQFSPDKTVLARYGVSLDRPFVLIRLVSWFASHDFGQRGFQGEEIKGLILAIQKLGFDVLISSEVELAEFFNRFTKQFHGEDVHHLIALSSLYVGESATMAAEAAILGTPAVHMSTRKIWYTNELEFKFKLVYNVRSMNECCRVVNELLMAPKLKQKLKQQRDLYLSQVDDLDSVVMQAIKEFE